MAAPLEGAAPAPARSATAGGTGHATASVQVLALRDGRSLDWPETVVGEEPLEIRVAAPGAASEPVAVTMRTPGNDFELATGFLLAEGVIAGPGEVRSVRYCVEAGEQQHNVVTVDLARPVELDRGRRFTVSASCGVCGTTSIDQLAERCVALPPGPGVPASVLLGLPGSLRRAQPVFDATGGVHAAGLFGLDGSPLAVREDVGRHNAVDKLLGWAALSGRLPSRARSSPSRGGSASRSSRRRPSEGSRCSSRSRRPSSLAVATARRLGVTLVAFARGERANVYSCPERVLVGA